MYTNLKSATASLVLFSIFTVLAVPANASPPREVSASIKNAQLRGEASLSVFGFSIYDADLFTPNGQAYKPGAPAAISLIYKRSFSRDDLIDSTREELIRIEGKRSDLDSLMGKISKCYRSVSKGSKFTAVSTSRNRLSLYLNGSRTCNIRHQNVSQRFLGIWLASNSRSPRFSRKLRGN